TIDTDEYRNARARQEVVKEMANSMYGITAERRGRYFNKNIAEAITLTGQFLNKTLAAIARKEGFLVIYSDTDSVFLVIDNKENMKKIADSLNKKLKNFLDAKFELKDNIIFAEYEKKYRKMIMLDKKRYTGHLTWMDGKKTDTIFTRGIETVKKNTIEYTRRNLNDMINMIVKENKTVKEIKKWLDRILLETENRRKEAADAILPVYTQDTNVFSDTEGNIREFFNSGREWLKESVTVTRREEFQKDIQEKYDFEIPSKDLRILIKNKFSAVAEESLISLLGKIYARGIILSKNLFIYGEQERGFNFLTGPDTEKTLKIEEIIDTKEGKEILAEE
ncbi:hypothetical protein LCGC14_3157930, partial [marine sediment metagenome]